MNKLWLESPESLPRWVKPHESLATFLQETADVDDTIVYQIADNGFKGKLNPCWKCGKRYCYEHSGSKTFAMRYRKWL